MTTGVGARAEVVRGGGGGEDGGCDRGDAGDGYLASEGRVAENLGGGVEVTVGVSCYDHSRFLGVSVRLLVVVTVVVGGGCWEGVREEELG